MEIDAVTQLDGSVKKAKPRSLVQMAIQTFRDKLPEIFPDRTGSDGEYDVPKTLVFAKTDSHADDIIQIIREEFGESSAFCKKVILLRFPSADAQASSN